VVLTTHTHLTPRLKCIPVFPLCAFTAGYRVKFSFYLFIKNPDKITNISDYVLYFISKTSFLFDIIPADAVYFTDVIDGDITKKTRRVFHQKLSSSSSSS